MQTLSISAKPALASDLPIRAIQFGEGNFLRGFLDWMLFKLNEQSLFNGRVAAVQPTPRGRTVPILKAQDGLYTVILHGIRDGRAVETFDTVNTIGDFINPYDASEWERLRGYARSAEVKFVFSNTTEAGIVYEKQELEEGRAPSSFPAKLAVLLHDRFLAFRGTGRCSDSGITVMPCELIDDNGTRLREIVERHAKDFGWEDEFLSYLEEDCLFLNTLVDRVVSGYPKDNAKEYEEKLGCEDRLMTCGELFHFLAIEGPDSVDSILPFRKGGLNVVIAPDITPYRLRKVRILNGAHTSNVPASYIAGLETVDQMMSDEVAGRFARSVIYDEIIPAVRLDKGMLREFADAVVERFMDPSMHHQLSSILMNCASKMRARVIPTLLDARSQGMLPKKLCFAVAAFLCLYRTADGKVPVQVPREGGKSGQFVDDDHAVKVLSDAWSHYQGTEASALLVAKAALSDASLWGRDLSSDLDVCALVAKLAHAVVSDGVMATMKDLLEHD
jgi:tagaturonate reductase